MKRFFDWLGEHWLLVFAWAMILIAVCVTVWDEGIQRHDRLIGECVADGFKEYECEAMLK